MALYRLQIFLNNAHCGFGFGSNSASQQFSKAACVIRRIAILYLVVIVFSVWGFAIGRFEVFPFRLINPFYDELTKFVRAYADKNAIEFVSKAIGNPQTETHVRFPGQAGFVDGDLTFQESGFLLLSRYSDTHNQSIVELWDLKQRKLIHEWEPSLIEIAERTQIQDDSYRKSLENRRFRTMHPLPLPDGGLIFLGASGPLVRIDKCSKIEWVNDGPFHHSIELAPDGTLWVPTVIEPSTIDALIPGHVDDALANISLQGEVLRRIPISQIFIENGERALILGFHAHRDNIHLNDIEPVHRDIGELRIGDLILSMRSNSTVAAYRPSDGRLIWAKTGPWLSQHDPDILPDGRVSIFSNEFVTNHTIAGGLSKAFIFDPASRTTTTPYYDAFVAAQIMTETEGRFRILKNGDAFVEEQNYGRILRISKEGVRWTYVNRMQDGSVGFLHWSRYFYRPEIDEFLESLTGVVCGGLE